MAAKSSDRRQRFASHLVAHVLVHRDAAHLEAPRGRRRVIAALAQPPGEALLARDGARLAWGAWPGGAPTMALPTMATSCSGFT